MRFSRRPLRCLRLHPPLPCRASPPQGWRSTRGGVPPISTFENEAGVAHLADLPPCGGDARQGRGGEAAGTEAKTALPLAHSHPSPQPRNALPTEAAKIISSPLIPAPPRRITIAGEQPRSAEEKS
ncbi:hypothetical protein NIBR502774_02085 [Rhizobium sp. NIBRBAC000502774]|nr:hypothetical protein NIBR502774_02085 [Rhizobium sp. NIBRBAC000502774]